MKKSNFLLVLFLCLFEQDSHLVSAASRFTLYYNGTEDTTAGNTTKIESRRGHKTRTGSDEETRSGRIPKRRLSPDTGELLGIEEINQQMKIIPEMISALKSKNTTLHEPRPAVFYPLFSSGFKTPPPNIEVKLPSSNDSISSSNSSNSYSSVNSRSTTSLYSFPRSASNFNLRPGHLATLNNFGSAASSFEPDYRSNSNSKYQSKSLIGDFSGDFVLPPTFMHSRIFKHDSHFLEKLDQCGLGCRSSDLDSELNAEDNFIGTELDEHYIFGSEEAADTAYSSARLSAAQTSYRSASATSELGRHLASTSLEIGRCLSTDQNNGAAGIVSENEKPTFQVEYAPWIPEDVDESFLNNSFKNLKSDFELKPLFDKIDAVEAPETDEGRSFFRNVFKPFQDYGEISHDEEKLKAVIESGRPLSEQVSEEVSRRRDENKKRTGREITSVRHEDALKYAKSASKLGLIEGHWIYTIVNGGTVDFFSYYQEIGETEEMNKWSVKRGRKLICAMIPSIMFSSNFEEVLIDFMDDFFLTHVLEIENENLQTEADQAAMIKELIKIGKEMIKHSLSHTIIENYLVYIKPLLLESDSEVLYETLVDTMNKFTVPKPFVPPKRREPELSDEKYTEYEDFDEMNRDYQADLSEYQNKVKKDERKIRYQEDFIRVKHIHKTRSFDILKVLVSLFPESIMRPDSRWINGNYLRMPRYHIEVDEEKQDEEGRQDEDKHESSRKKKKQLVEQKLFGVGAHENQDFFDALFFSRILRACLVQESTIELAANSLDPFLKSFQITIFDSPLSFRYLKVIDKFIRISRFNVVANCPPPIINYKRYLIAYLIRNGANWMGILPSKVQSRAINFEFLSLFEALHLYQVVDPSTPTEREQRMKALIAEKEINYIIPIIYYTYNPIPYSNIARIIEDISKEVPSISYSKLNGYYEIFAMAKNVDLLPITERNVLKFKNIKKSPEDPITGLQSNNEDLEFRPPLPKQYDATFVWNMSRRLKNLSELGNHLNYPYGTFASRIVLARRFGVSFDASSFIPQLSENFTWPECIDFVNFFLEREAQLLIERANTDEIDSDLYQVYRVYDTQRHLHKIRQMESDEPTHHINLLIESAVNGLSKEEANEIRSRYSQSHLFNLYKRGLGKIEPTVLFRLSREQAIKILKWFLDDDNIPETFSLRLIE